MALLNLTFIEENVSDDPEFIQELLMVFKQDVFTDFEALQASITKGDFSSIRTDAHKVKSSLRSLGAEECWTRLQELEDLGRLEADINRIRQLSAEVNELLHALRNEVEAYLEKSH